MRKFNLTLVNGKILNAEIVDQNLVFEASGTYRTKHLIALKSIYKASGSDFIVDSRSDIVIPNRSFLILLEELEDETGYIHVRKTVDVISNTVVIDDKK